MGRLSASVHTSQLLSSALRPPVLPLWATAARSLHASAQRTAQRVSNINGTGLQSSSTQTEVNNDSTTGSGPADGGEQLPKKKAPKRRRKKQAPQAEAEAITQTDTSADQGHAQNDLATSGTDSTSDSTAVVERIAQTQASKDVSAQGKETPTEQEGKSGFSDSANKDGQDVELRTAFVTLNNVPLTATSLDVEQFLSGHRVLRGEYCLLRVSLSPY